MHMIRQLQWNIQYRVPHEYLTKTAEGIQEVRKHQGVRMDDVNGIRLSSQAIF